MAQPGPVAIVGAGIAGLTAALSLARKGISTDILEQASSLDAVGAGLQLSPNATRVLHRLGLTERLRSVSTEPSSVDLVDGRSLRRIASVPAGEFARHRWHSPYAALHRADLQGALLAAVTEQPLCRLQLGHRLDTITPDALADITGNRPRLIVGADGVRSRVRDVIPGAGVAQFSGNIAWRFTVANEGGSPIFDRSRVAAFLGGRSHLVAYPLSGRDRFNIVAITSDPAARDLAGSDIPAPTARRRLTAAFAGWNPQITSLLEMATEPSVWPLYAVTDGGWHRADDTVLIGDAAHAMMPFAAQGAAMAIEDAFELASFVAAGLPLSAFVAHRKGRIARVRSRGDFNRFAYHARGPVRLGRDIVLSLRGPESLAADFDWLYGYEPRD